MFRKSQYFALYPRKLVVIPGSVTKDFNAGPYNVPCLIIGKESTNKKTSLNDALRDYNVSASTLKWLQKCLEILSSGVIIYPTDTVYGIGCDATNLSSISRINEIKNRNLTIILICFDERMEMLKNYVTDLPDVSKKYLLDSNEPTTVIFNKRK